MREGSLVGAVLAGGRSRRYGRPKHGVAVAGRPMVVRALDALAHSSAEAVIISSGPVDGAGQVPVVPDRVSHRGPLGGLHAALCYAAEAGHAGVVLLACDLPLVGSEVVNALVGAWLEDPAPPAVAPTRAGGGIEPLCAIYAVHLLPDVERRLEGADLSIHALFRDVNGRTVDLGGDAFLNVNTPRDRDRAEEALSEREGA